MSRPLPLFMLRTVLYPHMPLSLHVFEQRYRDMMRDCVESQTSFGVIAIKNGSEVGTAAKPRRVGTLARIVHIERLEDGRMNLLITGATRFRIDRLLSGKPYATAEVTYLEEPDDGVPDRLRDQLVRAFQTYVRTLQLAGGGMEDVPKLPQEAEVASYLVAAALEGSLDAKQQLLEAATVRERMMIELATLHREQDLLQRQVLHAPVRPGSFSLN